MPLTAAQLNAYAADQGLVAADQTKLTTDQATEATDHATIAGGLDPAGQAVLSADGKSVVVFTPIAGNPPTFSTAIYQLAT